jgi:hypothetical protein
MIDTFVTDFELMSFFGRSTIRRGSLSATALMCIRSTEFAPRAHSQNKCRNAVIAPLPAELQQRLRNEFCITKLQKQIRNVGLRQERPRRIAVVYRRGVLRFAQNSTLGSIGAGAKGRQHCRDFPFLTDTAGDDDCPLTPSLSGGTGTAPGLRGNGSRNRASLSRNRRDA